TTSALRCRTPLWWGMASITTKNTATCPLWACSGRKSTAAGDRPRPAASQQPNWPKLERTGVIVFAAEKTAPEPADPGPCAGRCADDLVGVHHIQHPQRHDHELFNGGALF